MLRVVDLLKKGSPISAVLADPGVKKRCEMLDSEGELFTAELRTHSRVDDNVVITDFRDLDHTPIGNRFLIYALFPIVNVSVRIHGGGGHKGAGSIPLMDEPEQQIEMVVRELKANG